MEMTNITPDVPVAAPQAAPQADVLMVRDPRKGGHGVTKMAVPAGQVEDFKAAGWTVA